MEEYEERKAVFVEFETVPTKGIAECWMRYFENSKKHDSVGFPLSNHEIVST
jgi:hypothetical protein